MSVDPFKGRAPRPADPMRVLHRFTRPGGHHAEIAHRDIKAFNAIEMIVFVDGSLLESQMFHNGREVERIRQRFKQESGNSSMRIWLLLKSTNAPRAMRQSLIPDPERAAIIRRVFKRYATGTYTKQEILQKATQWGLTNRRGQPLSSQSDWNVVAKSSCTSASSTSWKLVFAVSVATSSRGSTKRSSPKMASGELNSGP
jgi:hypothetical protein